MSKRNRIRIADVAREVGLTELEAIERLRQNGVTVREGYRISNSDLQRVRKILSNENGDVDATQEADIDDEATTSERGVRDLEVGTAANDVVECQSVEERMRVIDVVEKWLAENPQPKHFTVAGRTYSDFIRTCYLFLLKYALRHGAQSTGIIVECEDRKRIEAFLDRGKELWDRRRGEEQAAANARREAEERRQAEERRRIDELNKSEQQRQARLLEEDNRRHEEALRRAEVLRKAEERRKAEEQRQKEAQLQAKLAAQRSERARVRQLYAKHRQAVNNRRAGIQSEQGAWAAWADYFSFVLRDRIERSAEVLFGSSQHPSYELLQKDPVLLKKLKDNLSFGDDQHPTDYQNEYVSAYYTLRYELGYGFEYSQVYGLLLGIMRQKEEEPLLDVLSIGSGQGVDYWGLCYALSNQEAFWPKIGWHGVDLEEWPDHILDDGLAQYSDGTDVCKLLSGMNKLDAKVLMFPKVISELPPAVIDFIASWLRRITFTRDVHYLCFAHTEQKSLDPSDSKHKGPKDHFLGTTESFLDAVKSATLIQAAIDGARRQSYSLDRQWYDPSVMSVRDYDVVWPGSQSGRDWTGTYPYLVYGGNGKGEGDWHVWRNDPTFKMDDRLWNTVKGIGSTCCPKYMSSQDWGYTDSTDCNVSRVGCDNSYFCPLHRYPRVKTGRIAYQIVRLVKQPSYYEDIPF